jgi:CubicO group peptidase (beta-lactamase class C family)
LNGPTIPGEGAGFSPEGLARIAPWMDRLVAEGRLAGLSVTVNRSWNRPCS